jgi:hypothetical protein
VRAASGALLRVGIVNRQALSVRRLGNGIEGGSCVTEAEAMRQAKSGNTTRHQVTEHMPAPTPHSGEHALQKLINGNSLHYSPNLKFLMMYKPVVLRVYSVGAPPTDLNNASALPHCTPRQSPDMTVATSEASPTPSSMLRRSCASSHCFFLAEATRLVACVAPCHLKVACCCLLPPSLPRRQIPASAEEVKAPDPMIWSVSGMVRR